MVESLEYLLGTSAFRNESDRSKVYKRFSAPDFVFKNRFSLKWYERKLEKAFMLVDSIEKFNLMVTELNGWAGQSKDLAFDLEFCLGCESRCKIIFN